MASRGDRFEPGQRVGDYELVMPLAKGGMAELFIARRAGLRGFEKFVVLKRILPHLAGSSDFVEMFLHEARIAATLEHPNIVPVFDFGRAGDDYFFVMPYVHGRDLLQILRETFNRGTRFPFELGVHVGIAMAAGLHYAHEQVGFDGQPLGIVHRDISPANVLVTYDGHVRVVDFGIAKAAAQTNVTRVGVRKGKAAYMSPEQIRGDVLDRRSDIWAIGVVLWEMAMMRRLFRGDNDLGMMHRIVNEPIERPSALDPSVPPRLEAIIMRCLAKEPAERYANAQLLQQDLEDTLRELGMQSAAAALGRFVVDLFGPPTYPWAAAAAALPPVMPTAVTAMAGDFSGSSETEHADTAEAFTGTDAFATARPGRAIGWIGAGVLAGLLPVLATWQWVRASEPEPSQPAVAVEPADDRDDRDTLARLVGLVNQPDPALALPYAQRHALLDRIAAHPELFARVDRKVNLALDLAQAIDSDDPCHTYAQALSEIARRREASLAPFVRDSPVPQAGSACDPLAARRDAVLSTLH